MTRASWRRRLLEFEEARVTVLRELLALEEDEKERVILFQMLKSQILTVSVIHKAALLAAQKKEDERNEFG